MPLRPLEAARASAADWTSGSPRRTDAVATRRGSGATTTGRCLALQAGQMPLQRDEQRERTGVRDAVWLSQAARCLCNELRKAVRVSDRIVWISQASRCPCDMVPPVTLAAEMPLSGSPRRPDAFATERVGGVEGWVVVVWLSQASRCRCDCPRSRRRSRCSRRLDLEGAQMPLPGRAVPGLNL